MINYLLVGAGGALGGFVRYKLGRIIAERTKGTFPIGTFVINITGAFILGIVSTMQLNANIYIFLADGFLGAYTTFSTFMYEGVNLFKDKEKLNAIVYIVCSVFIGLLGFVIGVQISGWSKNYITMLVKM
jgi:CrcB protein